MGGIDNTALAPVPPRAGVSDARRGPGGSAASFALSVLLRRGAVVVDGGTGAGGTALDAARLAGSSGHVHAFDPYREQVRQASALVESSGLSSRVTFHDALLGEGEGGAAFYAAAESSGGAPYSTRNPDLLHFHPDAERRLEPLLALDHLGLAPDAIHLDIEGGEYLALIGARGILERRHPHLVIQTHGDEIDGIGGSVSALAGLLAALAYPLFDLIDGRLTSAHRFARAWANRPGALVASQGLLEPEVLAELTAGCLRLRQDA